MDLGLDGRSAVVAGASSGLGLATAIALAREGAHVAIGARSEERLSTAHHEVDAAGPGQVRSTALDLRDHAAVGAWIDDASDAHNGIGIAVVNAGGPPAGIATDFSVGDYREAVELSLLAHIAMAQHVLPYLMNRPWGRLIFIASSSVKQPIPQLALSNTSRAGVAGYAKSLVHALQGSRVTVNVLAPGLVRTARVDRILGEDGVTSSAEQIPAGRLGSPEEFADVTTFVASGRSSYLNGCVIPVDGGATRSLY